MMQARVRKETITEGDGKTYPQRGQELTMHCAPRFRPSFSFRAANALG